MTAPLRDARLDLGAIVRSLGVADIHSVRLIEDTDLEKALALKPWLVVVRKPGEAARATLAEAGYLAAADDDVSHVYVAATHRAVLEPRLRLVSAAADSGADPSSVASRSAAAEVLLAIAQARDAGSRERMLDAVRAIGLARADVTTMAGEAKWLRGLIDEGRAAEANLRAETAWLRALLEDANALSGRQRAEADWLRLQLAEGSRSAEALQRQLVDLDGRAAHLAQRASTAEAALRRRPSTRIWRMLKHTTRSVRPPAPAPSPGLDAASASEAAVESEAAPDPAPLAGAVMVEQPVIAAPSQPAARMPARHDGPVTTVHQFHAGSAAGSAITNGMLLIRGVLRARGFRSDIHVKQRGAGLEADGILMFEEMSRHGDYVLLLHHSMGYPEFDEVVALPARKVLVYHNITPPQFLTAVPWIERMARIGREQLAAAPDRFVAALADSDYNALELNALRYAAVRTCPLLFDVADLAARITEPRISDGVFTVLFVGRVTPSKGQDALIRAFAAFRPQFARPSRLVLVGPLDPDDHEFLGRLDDLMTGLGVGEHVVLSGLVSDVELADWYRQADLFVSLSQHEGFCVPLIEAMAAGIPTLAWPCGAVAETLGGAGTLLASREPEAVAQSMLTAAAADRPSVAAGCAPRLDRFALSRHVPTLMEALATGGAVAPPDKAVHAHLAANLHVAITGHVGKSYSLAAVNRAMAGAIELQRPGTVRLIPVEGQPTDNLAEVPAADLPLVERLVVRRKPDGLPELIISQHYPVHVPSGPADFKAALFFWEETLIPAATVATLNAGFDAVFAPSRFVARALVDSGVSLPVIMIGHAPVLPEQPGTWDREGPFTFLHVSSAFPRKGVDVLLAAWRIAFASGDPVRLVLKTSPNPHNSAPVQVAALRGQGDAAPVTLIDEELPADAMLGLLRQADAMVLPTRGEGYNLPAAEAMAAGLALITTGFGGHMDFCTPGTARLLASRLEPSGSHLATPHSLWAEPDPADLAAALQEVFAAGREGLAGQLAAARTAITAAADPAAWVARLTAATAALLLAAPRHHCTRIAWISTWDVRCGIAEYSHALVAAMPEAGITVLAEERTAPAPDGPSPAVSVAWRLGDPANVERLSHAVARLDADVVVIQHQPALFDWPVLARLVTQLVDRGLGVAVTLHNTRHLVDSEDAVRAGVVQALDRAARVLVHTVADVQALRDVGLANPAVLMPHAAQAPASATVRALPADAVPVVGCTGFFLPGKGIETLIRAVGSLRGRWPSIRVRLVNAEYDHPHSAAEIAKCRALAKRMAVDVDWLTDFKPLDAVVDSLRGCDLVVLPNDHSLESSSASLRTALATGVPVAVTPLALFDEAGSAVARFGGTDAGSVAAGIADLLGDDSARSRLQAAAGEWLAAHSVDTVARRMAGMIEGLAAQRRAGQPLDGGLWRQ